VRQTQGIAWSLDLPLLVQGLAAGRRARRSDDVTYDVYDKIIIYVDKKIAIFAEPGRPVNGRNVTKGYGRCSGIIDDRVNDDLIP
jgi:hypothetical protein